MAFTREQADRIIAVIKTDANTTGMLFEGDDKACVIGGLYEAAFKTRPNRLGTDLAISEVSLQYGFTVDQGHELVQINDNTCWIRPRRIKLIKQVNSWVEGEE